ncbi:hypothetical protein [Nonomuraea sp. 10N515B]|uniref:hypothetical protein n=1 Tax=Nonomuraea sp. 10N515B TaxID=3457422 RepID=UPI003FCCD3EB
MFLRASGPRPGGDGNDRLPLGLAVLLIIVIAVLLTLAGMFLQILANLSGAQLPGA